MYQKGLQIDRQRKLPLNKQHGCNLCLKQVIDYKNPEMLSKFTSQNGRILSFKHTNKIILKKNIHGKK
jgi:ribosomal protein S18